MDVWEQLRSHSSANWPELLSFILFAQTSKRLTPCCTCVVTSCGARPCESFFREHPLDTCIFSLLDGVQKVMCCTATVPCYTFSGLSFSLIGMVCAKSPFFAAHQA